MLPGDCHGILILAVEDQHNAVVGRSVGPRRAWVEPANVINTRSRADLLAWVAAKPDRV